MLCSTCYTGLHFATVNLNLLYCELFVCYPLQFCGCLEGWFLSFAALHFGQRLSVWRFGCHCRISLRFYALFASFKNFYRNSENVHLFLNCQFDFQNKGCGLKVFFFSSASWPNWDSSYSTCWVKNSCTFLTLRFSPFHFALKQSLIS